MRKEKMLYRLLNRLYLTELPEGLKQNIQYILNEQQVLERDKQIFNEYYFEGLSPAEIGLENNISTTGVTQVASKVCHLLRTPRFRGMLIYGPNRKQELDLKSSVADLDLTNRSFVCLYRAGIYTIEDLINLDFNQLQHIRNMSKKSLAEIVEKLNKNGFYLNVISS